MPYGTFNESAFPSYAEYLKSQMSRISAQKRIQEQEEAYQKECEERRRKAEEERAAKEAEEAAAAAARATMLEDVKFMPMALRIKRQQSLAEKRKAYAADAGSDVLGAPAKKQKVVVQSSVLTSAGGRAEKEREQERTEQKSEVKREAEAKNEENAKDKKNEEDADDAFADFMNDMKELGAF